MASSLFRNRQPSVQQQIPNTNSGTFQPPSNLGQIKGLLNMMKTGGNPQGMVQSMLQNSPQGGEIVKYLNAHGGDARAAFYDMAKQKGVDPNTVLNMLN